MVTSGRVADRGTIRTNCIRLMHASTACMDRLR